MKILVIGDPHGEIGKAGRVDLSKVDLKLITGDIGKADLARKRFFENLERTRKDLPELPDNAKHAKAVYNEIHSSTINVLRHFSKQGPVYTLQGNVGIMNITTARKDSEKWGIKFPCTKCQVDKMKNVYIVKNRLRILNGLRVGFLEHFIDTDDAKKSKDKKRIAKAKKGSQKAKKVLKSFGKGLDILLCHAPPYGYLDKVSRKYGAPKRLWGKHVGSKIILDYIKKKQPRYVFCGHIHEGKGHIKIGKSEVYNVGCDGDYILLDIEK